jgi:hypothetical protein
MHTQITPTPFEQMLEDLQTAITAGDTQTEQRLRAMVEADLNARGAVYGLTFP